MSYRRQKTKVTRQKAGRTVTEKYHLKPHLRGWRGKKTKMIEE